MSVCEMRDAEVVVLKQTGQPVFEFHRYAARLRTRGKTVNCGDQVNVFQVDSTVPDGPVRVTDSTEFVFSA